MKKWLKGKLGRQVRVGSVACPSQPWLWQSSGKVTVPRRVCRQRWASRSSHTAQSGLFVLPSLMVTFWLVTWSSKFAFTDMCGLQSCLYMRYVRYLWDGVLETLGLRLFAGHSAVSGNVVTWPRAQ